MFESRAAHKFLLRKNLSRAPIIFNEEQGGNNSSPLGSFRINEGVSGLRLKMGEAGGSFEVRADGGIGRRDSLRSCWGNPWRFKSSSAHGILGFSCGSSLSWQFVI